MFETTERILSMLEKWLSKRAIRKHYEQLDDLECARQMTEAQMLGDLNEWEWKEIFED